MSATNLAQGRSCKVTDTKNVTIWPSIFDWHHLHNWQKYTDDKFILDIVKYGLKNTI